MTDVRKSAIIDIRLQTAEAKKKAIELKKDIAQLEVKQRKWNAALKEAVTTQGKSSAQATKYAKALTLVQTKLKAARTNFNAYTKEMNRGNQAFATGVRRAAGLTKALTSVALRVVSVTALLMAMRRAVTGSIDSFRIFEKTLTDVQTLLTSNEQTLEEGSIQIMKEYGFAIEDVNKAMFDAVSAGIEATEVTEFLGEAARLAVGGVTDLKTGVKGLVFILNTYSLGVEHATAVSDAFYSAQKFGVTTVQELVEHLGRVAPIANTAGISFQTMLGSLASLTKGGLKTEEAVTILRQVISALIKPAHQASLVLKDAGVPTGILAIKTKGLVFALEQLNKAYRENPDAIAQMIPNIRAFTGVAAFSTERLEELKEIIEAVYNDSTSLTRAFNEQMKTYQKQLDRFRANVKAIGIEIGRAMKPFLTHLMSQFNEFVDNAEPVVTTLKRVNKEISDQIEIIKDGNFTLDQRQELMGKLNQEYAAYLPFLFKEEATVKNIEAYYRAINSHLQAKILYTVYEQELAKIYGEQAANAQILVQMEEDRQKRIKGQGGYAGMNAAQTAALDSMNANLADFFTRQIEGTADAATEVEERMTKMAKVLGLVWEDIKKQFALPPPTVTEEVLPEGGLSLIERQKIAQKLLTLRRKFEDSEIAIMKNSASKKVAVENLRYSRAVENLQKELIVKEDLNKDEIAVNDAVYDLIEQNYKLHYHNLNEIMQQAHEAWVKDYRDNKQKEIDETRKTAEEIARFRKKYLGDTQETMKAELDAFVANEHFKTLTVKEQEQAMAMIRGRHRDKWIQQAVDAAESVTGAIFQIQAERAERAHTKELDALSDRQDGELAILKNRLEAGSISEEQYKQSKEASDKKFREREDKINRKKFEEDKKRNTQEAIIAGALGAARAVASGWGNPLVWGPMVLISAIETLAQIAVIQAAQYKEGGITDGGMQSKPYLGLVAEAGPEWISPNWMLNDSVTAPIISALESYRSGGPKAFADGGLTARALTAPVRDDIHSQDAMLAMIRNQPPSIVIVKDILAGVERVVSVEQRATI